LGREGLVFGVLRRGVGGGKTVLQVQTREDEVLLRGTLTNSSLRAGNPGKGSCF